MSGDIRSSDSESLTDSSENVRVANGTSRPKTKPGTPVGITQRKGGNSSNNSHAAANDATTGGGIAASK